MCIMALANLTYERMKSNGTLPAQNCIDELNSMNTTAVKHAKYYFNFETEILPFFESQWENITSMPRRVKSTWHGTLLRTITKETELFEAEPDNSGSFALKESDLFRIGPNHEAVVQVIVYLF